MSRGSQRLRDDYKRKPNAGHASRDHNQRGKPVTYQSNTAHVGIPTWLVPIVVNVGVLMLGVAATWFTMQGDIGNLKTQINGLSNTVTAQIARIDGIVKEQDRITRMEERLGNISALLNEIKTDLKEGRYAVRRDGTITPSAPLR